MVKDDLVAEGFYQSLLDSLADGVYFVDINRTITYWNRGAESISGYSSEEVVGRSCQDNLLVHTDSNGCQLCLDGCPLLSAFRTGENKAAEVFLKHKQGHRLPVAVKVAPVTNTSGTLIGGVECFSENSSKTVAIERAAELERLALLDPLTEVGNRRFTNALLQQHWDVFQREKDPFAVLFVDLDHFKAVNDTYGHDAGDAVLRAVSKTLSNSLRSYDILGRWGGEEFLIIVSKGDREGVRALAARCCALVRTCAVERDGKLIRPTISIGAAVAQEGETIDHVVGRADANLYQAKADGRDRFQGP